jgi:hypothetical protein
LRKPAKTVVSYKPWVFGTIQYWAARKRARLEKTIVAAQPPGFAEFGGSAFGFASSGIGRGEMGVNDRCGRNGAARFFQPDDRLVGA